MRALAILVLATGIATAQPAPTGSSGPSVPSAATPIDPAVALREANAAATAGDWARVDATVRPLLALQLDRTDLAEAHRLAGIAALLAQPRRDQAAEHHFLAYLRIDLDGHLDPALYPPEVVNFFNNVRAVHASELKTLRPRPKRYAVLAVLPPFAQFQNGDRTKGFVLAGLVGAFAITNVTTYLVLRSWCNEQQGPLGSSVACDANKNRNGSASMLQSVNILAGIGLISTYMYGVYDGVRGYRRDSRALQPFVASSREVTLVGVSFDF